MPADPDEDLVLTPAVLRPLPPAGPRAGSPTGPTAGFSWGVVGFLHEAAELVGSPGCQGVVRFVNGDISYAAPPLPAAWAATPGTPGRFEMPWPGDPAAARTLIHLRADLDRAARSGALKSGASPLLAELDAVADGLLDTTARLHAAGWTLGLVQPGNVVLAGTTPHLVDLGFTWRGSFGPPPWDASPGRPAWMDASAAWLSDVPAVRRQFADPGAAHFPRVEPVEDVRTLARLFAWLLTGQPRGEVVAPSRTADLWQLLAEAAAGGVPTAHGFRARLAADPLRGHFTDPPKPPPPPSPPPAKPFPWGPALAAAAVAVVAAGGVAVYLLAAGPTAPTTPATQSTPVDPPPPPTPANFQQALADLDAALATKELPAVVEKVKLVYALGPVAAADEAARQARRETFADLCVEEYKAALTLSRQPARRFDAVGRLRALESQLKSLADPPLPPAAAALHEKETQCLELVTQLAQQLAS